MENIPKRKHPTAGHQHTLQLYRSVRIWLCVHILLVRWTFTHDAMRPTVPGSTNPRPWGIHKELESFWTDSSSAPCCLKCRWMWISIERADWSISRITNFTFIINAYFWNVGVDSHCLTFRNDPHACQNSPAWAELASRGRTGNKKEQ